MIFYIVYVIKNTGAWYIDRASFFLKIFNYKFPRYEAEECCYQPQGREGKNHVGLFHDPAMPIDPTINK